jgi:hypothetical protein
VVCRELEKYVTVQGSGVQPATSSAESGSKVQEIMINN